MIYDTEKQKCRNKPKMYNHKLPKFRTFYPCLAYEKNHTIFHLCKKL